MQPVKDRFLLAAVAAVALLSACKKDDVKDLRQPVVSAEDLLKDSALEYSKDIYLWYEQIPGDFDARQHGNLDQLLTSIRQFSKEPGFSTPVDRWSFAVPQQDWDDVSSGISGDFGLQVFFRAEGDLRVRSVEKTSPAGQAGVRRGWRITAINGNSQINTSNADFIVQAVWNSSSTQFRFQKPDGSHLNLTLQAASYQENPVLLDSVYQLGSKRVGYFAFNSFLGDTNKVYQEYDRIFQRFAAAGVNELIVDLRYNGGGYVSMQQKLANWLVPSSANGQPMMNQQFNGKYSQYNTTDVFQKLGSLNPGRIFFIVSNSTASASELLINNLKPYLDVYLIGPHKTYGKPVGYFPIPVGDWYIFPVSFRSTNKLGEGNYFNGLALHHQVADGLDKDWGDIHESCLQSALSFITTGSYGVQRETDRHIYRAQQEVRSGNLILDSRQFKGAVDIRNLN